MSDDPHRYASWLMVSYAPIVVGAVLPHPMQVPAQRRDEATAGMVEMHDPEGLEREGHTIVFGRTAAGATGIASSTEQSIMYLEGPSRLWIPGST